MVLIPERLKRRSRQKWAKLITSLVVVSMRLILIAISRSSCLLLVETETPLIGNKLGSTAGATSSEPKETYVPPTTATVTTTSAPSNGNVTLRLPNGTTVKGQFTAGSTLQEVVNLAKQHISNCVLMGGWPPRALTSGDYSKTLGELALLNSVITVKNA